MYLEIPKFETILNSFKSLFHRKYYTTNFELKVCKICFKFSLKIILELRRK